MSLRLVQYHKKPRHSSSLLFSFNRIFFNFFSLWWLARDLSLCVYVFVYFCAHNILYVGIIFNMDVPLQQCVVMLAGWCVLSVCLCLFLFAAHTKHCYAVFSVTRVYKQQSSLAWQTSSTKRYKTVGTKAFDSALSQRSSSRATSPVNQPSNQTSSSALQPKRFTFVLTNLTNVAAHTIYIKVQELFLLYRHIIQIEMVTNQHERTYMRNATHAHLWAA